jgi:hypothetical protein
MGQRAKLLSCKQVTDTEALRITTQGLTSVTPCQQAFGIAERNLLYAVW